MNIAALRFLAVEDHEFQRLVLLRILAGLGPHPGHWDLLLTLGCQLAQGYFIAGPMEGSAFANWAHAREHAPRLH